MTARRPDHLWNRLVLGMLVLLVTGAALGTVADSALAQGRTSTLIAANAS